MTPIPLPTIKQAREARRLINRGRKAMGLPALRYLDFDNAESGSPYNCLSARNVFAEAGYEVRPTFVRPLSLMHRTSKQARPSVLSAMGMPEGNISDAILAVTEAFDAEVEGLRERLVEAGVVKP